MKGHKHERKPGVWSLVIPLGRDHLGKQRQKWVTFKGGERAAQKELNRLLVEAQKGTLLGASKQTVAQFLEHWLENCARVRVSPRTFERYEEIVRKHLIPQLGKHQLEKLAPQHIQSAHREALENGRRDGKGGLSAQTVLHHHRVLRTALHQAVEWDLLIRNPADRVDPPTVEDREAPALDQAQYAQLLEGIKDTPVYMAALLAGFTGMRRGEILALRWQDVDLNAGTLSVNQSLQQLKGGRAGVSFKSPKTKRSRRTIEISSSLVEALIRHKGQQAQRRLMMGSVYQDQGLVVCREDGLPIVPNQLTQRFCERMKKLGIPITFKALRHTHASVLLKLGEPLPTVSVRLGHSNTHTTATVYAHALPGTGRAAANAFDAAMQKAAEPAPADWLETG